MRAELPQIGVWVLEAPPGREDAVRAALAASGEFEHVEPDAVASPGQDPNDPCYPSQWHLRKIQAPGAWSLSAGSASVTVAVVDSGVEAGHPDLAGKIVPGWNFLNGTADTSDVFGHGTSVAGAAAANSNNATGIAGVAWEARVMPLVALDANDRALYSDIARAILYAADHGVRVINVSLGGPTPSDALQSAVDYAWGRGAVVVASAMNASNATPQYPAACDKVLAVAATTALDTLAPFSSFGGWVDLSAPGSSVLTTLAGGKYAYRNGTSFAAPQVAGVAALLLAVRPGLTAEELVGILLQTCDDLGAPGFDPSFGWGRLNAGRALRRALAGQ